jgi:hypothetical protein
MVTAMLEAGLPTKVGTAPEHEMRCRLCRGAYICLDVGLFCSACRIVIQYAAMERVAKAKEKK